MAYLANPTQEEENQQGPIQASSAPGGIISGTGGQIPGGQAPASPAPSQKGSGMFTNLQQYVQKNRDQSQGLGEKVAGTIGEKAQSAVQGIQRGQADIASQAQTGVSRASERAMQDVIGNPLAARQESLAQVRAQLSGQYAGPMDVKETAGFNVAQQARTQAEEALKRAQTAQGQRELIQGQYSQGRRAGLSKLDQVLMQNAPGSREALEAAQAQGQQRVQEAFRQAEMGGTQAIQQAQQQATQGRTQALSELQRVLGSRQAEAQQSLQAQQADIAKRIQDAVRAQLTPQGGPIVGAVEQQMINRQVADALRGMELASQRADVTSVMSPDQIAQYNALAELAGIQGLQAAPQAFSVAAEGDMRRLAEWQAANQAQAREFRIENAMEQNTENRRLGAQRRREERAQTLAQAQRERDELEARRQEEIRRRLEGVMSTRLPPNREIL